MCGKWFCHGRTCAAVAIPSTPITRRRASLGEVHSFVPAPAKTAVVCGRREACRFALSSTRTQASAGKGETTTQRILRYNTTSPARAHHYQRLPKHDDALPPLEAVTVPKEEEPQPRDDVPVAELRLSEPRGEDRGSDGDLRQAAARNARGQRGVKAITLS